MQPSQMEIQPREQPDEEQQAGVDVDDRCGLDVEHAGIGQPIKAYPKYEERDCDDSRQKVGRVDETCRGIQQVIQTDLPERGCYACRQPERKAICTGVFRRPARTISEPRPDPCSEGKTLQRRVGWLEYGRRDAEKKANFVVAAERPQRYK